MEKRAFSSIGIPARSEKPRNTGITMMVDFGIGIEEQRDVLELAGEFIDIGKIAVGVAGILSEKNLLAKIDAYKKFRVTPFLGGQFLEYTIFKHGLDRAEYYFEEHRRLGLEMVEISDNNIDIAPEDKFELIRKAREDFGLKVLGEVGTKTEVTDVAAIVEDIQGCLSAGSSKVFVEAAELVGKSDGAPIMEMIEGISRGCNVEDIIFELPGPWIKNVHHFNVLAMQLFLVNHFGPEVNVANVYPDKVIYLETLRTGVGVSACLEK
jgi:phosphosulfolactate synthase